jgi:O-antigen ligase
MTRSTQGGLWSPMFVSPFIKPDNLVLVLIFLFPLFGNLIKSWYSTIFCLIAFISLCYIKQGWSIVDKFQKRMAYTLIAFFVVFVVNASLLGWHSLEFEALAVEIRFVFIIPLLCMAAIIPGVKKALYYGLIGSLLVFVAQVIYELVIMQQGRVMGVYNPLRISAMALIAVSVLVPWLWHKQYCKRAILVMLIGVLVIVASQGRMAMIGVFIIAILFGLVLVNRWKNRIFALLSIGLIGFSAISTPVIQDRFVVEIGSLSQYITNDKQVSFDERSVTSWVVHYQMLEASWILFKEHPVLGVGSKHYIEHMKRYVAQGRVHPIIGQGDLATPHTMIAEIAVSKGSLGIIIFITFILTALTLVIRRGREGAALGMLVLGVLLTGISEAWWVRTGSFVSALVLYLAIFSAVSMQECKEKNAHAT